MRKNAVPSLTLAVAGFLAAPAFGLAGDEPVLPLTNWETPDERTAAAGPQLPTNPLTFVGIVPCRMADTRDGLLPPGYGPPALGAGSFRNFVLTGRCGIPTSALAVSANVTVVNPPGPGFLLIRPTDGPTVTVSTLNFIPNQTTANAAVIPLGTAGSATFLAGVTGTELVIDVNGYYLEPRGGGVSTLNALSGDVTLAAGSNVTITPSGNTLTVAATSGGGGDITDVTAGAGLSGGGTTGSVTLSVNPAATQARVVGTCTAGSSIRAVAQDGTVTCEPDDAGTGTVTSVGAGAGLTGGPITTSGSLAVSFAGDGVATTAARSDHNHFGQNWNGSGIGLTAITTDGVGLRGITHSTATSYGVYGYASATSGTPFGVRGESLSPSGFGVAGFGAATTGNSIGVYGNTNSPTGYAGYFTGRVHIGGDLNLNGELTTFATATIAATGDGVSASTTLTLKRFCAITRMNQVGSVNPGTNFSCAISKSGTTFTLTARASSASHVVTCDMACF